MKDYEYLAAFCILIICMCIVLFGMLIGRYLEFKEWEENHILETGTTYKEAGIE